jgi:protoporphyrinogen oxidase
LETTDTLIIGAGPAGLTTAYSLVKTGHGVTVIEQDKHYVGGISRTVSYSYCVINFLRRGPLATGVAQHGHRERVLTSAMINLLRIVAIELGTWRSVLGGGASGSITFGNGKFFEPSGVASS